MNMIWMLIGCTVPLLLIFLGPVLGLSQGSSLFLFILGMFACHLLIPHGHGKRQPHHHVSKERENEHHQH